MAPVVLIVLDGVGHNENPRGNAVLAARTPFLDHLHSRYPSCLLDASGEAVGLPPGFQGSSEVGHLCMGAGRVIEQELKRINDQLASGALYRTSWWQRAVANWKTRNSRLHFLGLLQDEGVHAHQDHLFRMLRQARQENPAGEIVVHPFLDGRDTPPRSTLEYWAQLRPVMEEIGHCRIGTFMGRYYAMDRAKNWDLTDQAYACLVAAKGRVVADPEAAVEASYEQDRTPTGEPMGDEYIPPHVVEGYTGIQDGDSVIHTNYRQDRAIQLSMAFVEDTYPGKRSRRPRVVYVGLTRYYDEFQPYLLQTDSTESAALTNLVGEIISRRGWRQLRIAETQKFRHVTSFFNGKSTTPFPGEDQVEIPSRFDPASFADHPEMDALPVTEEVLRRLEDNPYSFILINYANGDMVGHTGNFEAAKTALEVIDGCLSRVVPAILERGGKILLTADHGNSDQMIDYETGRVRTSHSTQPVDCVYIAGDASSYRMRERGILPDIGPTLLQLLGLPVPPDMTATPLLNPKT
ncbi:MAG: 2,3-bisphosphoglycerate-independent phosphoglycerate mutase [Candidatus Neomarinimicrobiota bacterium]|nr:MAG: 2,3-bisphosphoglycerate-independent phosphoglycerate mutase [Candidatus Neomarinimicrobiota bacterium]